MKRPLIAAAVLLALAAPAMAQAELAQMTGDAYLYAGPDPGYPMVATLYAGTTVDVQGCTAGWQWCDVIVANLRGWVPGAYLEYDYDNQPVLISNYGATIGIPIVSFSLGWYWGNFYRGMPFYDQYRYWYGWRPPYRPPPQPFPRGPWHPGPGWHGGLGPGNWHGPGPGWRGGPGPAPGGGWPHGGPPPRPAGPGGWQGYPAPVGPPGYGRPMPMPNGWQAGRPGNPQPPVNGPGRHDGARTAPPPRDDERRARDDHQDHP